MELLSIFIIVIAAIYLGKSPFRWAYKTNLDTILIIIELFCSTITNVINY